MDHPEYLSWVGMFNRCGYAGHNRYSNYGGRGIKVCDRWQDFWNFLDDMGPKPSPYHSIDRIVNDKDYEPGNCRWATPKEQARNRTSSVHYEIAGESRTLGEWIEHYGEVVSYHTAHQRISKLGWDIVKAVTTKSRGFTNGTKC